MQTSVCGACCLSVALCTAAVYWHCVWEGNGKGAGLRRGEERRGRERVQQSEREKVRATHQIERDAESRRRGPLDFCQGFPATAEAGIDSFFPHPRGFAFSTAFPGSSVIGRVVERSAKEWRKGAQQRGTTCPRPASVQRWGLPWRKVEKLITVLGYKLFRQVNGSAKLWEVNSWRLAPWS